MCVCVSVCLIIALQSINATASTTTDIVRCCTFEAEAKGVMFYKGYSELNPRTFQRIIFTRDHCCSCCRQIAITLTASMIISTAGYSSYFYLYS